MVANYKSQAGKRIFFFLLFFLPLSSVKADQIRIRTIITPVGSQSEKWGAKGLMVCIGGQPIASGGCNATGGYRINPDNSRTEITFDVNDVVIFEDTSDGSAAGSNHQYDYTSGSESSSDTVYEVRGGGGCPTPYRVIGPFSGTNCTTECANAGHSCAFGQYYGHGVVSDFYYIINCSSSVVNPVHGLYCACCDD
ncbi:MAG: hypothetical protein KAS87_01380 [Candidatus Omnitrophica bacterium]|nr:hypothetical protein [Candidatus Omnitrophota bacterium]